MDEETQLVAPEVSNSPATLSAEQLAAQVIEALDLLSAWMALETPHPATARRVRGGRTVSREFVAAMIAAVEADPVLQGLRTFDTAEARDVLQSRDAGRVVADRVAMFLKSVNYTMEARWAKVAREALTTFNLATGLARDSKSAELAAHVENLRRHLGRTNKPKPKKKKAGGEGEPR